MPAEDRNQNQDGCQDGQDERRTSMTSYFTAPLPEGYADEQDERRASVTSYHTAPLPDDFPLHFLQRISAHHSGNPHFLCEQFRGPEAYHDQNLVHRHQRFLDGNPGRLLQPGMNVDFDEEPLRSMRLESSILSSVTGMYPVRFLSHLQDREEDRPLLSFISPTQDYYALRDIDFLEKMAAASNFPGDRPPRVDMSGVFNMSSPIDISCANITPLVVSSTNASIQTVDGDKFIRETLLSVPGLPNNNSLLTFPISTTQLSEISGSCIGVEATEYLKQMIEISAHEPLLAALGGAPIGLKHHLEAELDRWTENNIKPLFVFEGQSTVGKDDIALRNAKEALDRTENAWKLYINGEPDKAVTAFGNSRMQSLHGERKKMLTSFRCRSSSRFVPHSTRSSGRARVRIPDCAV